MTRTRVLTLSKPYVSATNRRKFTLLAREPEWEIGLICPDQWANVKFEQPAENESYSIRHLPIAFNGRNHFHYYRGLQRAIEEFRPDILNVEEEHYSLVTFQAFHIARRLGIKPLFFAWQNIHKRYPLPFRMIESYVFRHARLAVVGNQSAADSIRAKGYGGEVFRTPQVGVDLSLYLQKGDPEEAGKKQQKIRADLGLPADDFIVLGAGRIVSEKGFQHLIEASDHLRDRPVTVVIVGSGPHAGPLQELRDRLRLGDRVRLIPFVPSLQMPAWFQAADVLCQPSLTRPNWKEQGPTRVISEAMASGANVIVSDSGELPDVVGDAGLIFPEGDAAQLARSIVQIMDHPDEARQRRDRAARRVVDRFSDQAIADRFSEAFRLVRDMPDTPPQR